MSAARPQEAQNKAAYRVFQLRSLTIWFTLELMKVNVQVKPRSKKEGVEVLTESSFVVRVNAPPTEGLANERVIELLAEYFQRPKSKIELIAGFKSKKKTFLIK